MSTDTTSNSLNQLLSLAGKTAVITGAAAGMGAAIARRFAEAGANLHLLDINQENLLILKTALAGYGVEINIHQIDLTNKSEIDLFWQDLSEPKPDILVNNAGIFPFMDFLDTDETFVDNVMKINYEAVYWMCQHFVRDRLKLGGTIVNIGSIEAQIPFKKDLAHYTTGKAAVIALTRALARDYGGVGIRANVILPGGIITEGTKGVAKGIWRNPGLIKDGINFRSRLPLARMGQPDEVARITLVLASDMSSYMTGAVVPVDGGFLSA